MKKSYIYSALILIMFMCSCGNQSETPVQLTERMKALACSGDIEGFYTYVDKLSIEKRLKEIASQLIREDITDPKTLKEFEEIVIPSLVVLKWEVMNSELKHGQESSFCNMQVLNELKNGNTIHIVFPDGKTSTWGFEDKSGQLILVSIVDKDPFDFAGLGLQSKTGNSFEGENRVTEKVSKNTEGTDKPKPSDNKQPVVAKQKSHTNTEPDSEEEKKVAASKKEPVQKEDKRVNTVDQPTPTPAIEPPVSGFDFGAARWGMTMGQVMSSEKSNPISEGAKSLKYIGTYNGVGAELEYVFSNDRLVRGRYRLLNPNSDQIAYLREYNRIKELLTARFGQPKVDEQRWTNSLYKDNPDRHGFAVYIGHLSLRSKWITNRSNISLELKSNNYNMLLEALYSYR